MGLLQKIAISPKIRNFVQLMQARVSALKFGRYQFIKFILCLAQTFVCNHQKISVRDLFIALKLVSYSHSVCVCLTKFQKKNLFSIFSIWTEKNVFMLKPGICVNCGAAYFSSTAAQQPTMAPN